MSMLCGEGLRHTLASHGCCSREGGCALQPDGRVAESLEGFEVATRPTPKIENHPRRLAVDVPQKRGDILADVVISRASNSR